VQSGIESHANFAGHSARRTSDSLARMAVAVSAELVLAILGLGFLTAIAFLVYRLYMEHKFTLWSMSDRHRGQLYAGLAVAFATLTATDRLLDSGPGLVLWIALLAGSVLAVYNAWVESRRYSI